MFSRLRCKIMPFSDLEAEKKCSICLSPLHKHNKRIIHLEKCLHSYHDNCIYKWLQKKNTCPCCRSVQNRRRLFITYNKKNRRTRSKIIKDMFLDCFKSQ